MPKLPWRAAQNGQLLWRIGTRSDRRRHATTKRQMPAGAKWTRTTETGLCDLMLPLDRLRAASRRDT
jgi:hypothetical protein